MAVRMLFVLAFLSLSVTIASASTPYQYLMFVLQWGKGVCQDTHCYTSPPSHFTIHGLWPSNMSLSKLDCTGTPFGREQFLKEPHLKTVLEQFSWPDIEKGQHMSFWTHEYNVHGICSENRFPQVQYFSKANQLWSMYKVDTMLRKASILPGKTYKFSDLEAAIKAETKSKPNIRCAKPKTAGDPELLLEVALCLDAIGKTPMDCDPDKSTCSTSAPILYKG